MAKTNLLGRMLLATALGTGIVGVNTSCAPRKATNVVVVSRAERDPLSYAQALLSGNVQVDLREAVEVMKELARMAKELSEQKPDPVEKRDRYKQPIVIIDSFYKKEDLLLKGLGLVGYAALGGEYIGKVYRGLSEALEMKGGDVEDTYKKLVIEAAQIVDDRKTAKGVALLLLNEEKGSKVANAATAALLNMEYGYEAVGELVNEDPSRIAYFKDLYTLFYLNASTEKKEQIARRILSLGSQMLDRASLEDYQHWLALLSQSGIAYDFPISTFNTLGELLTANPFGGSYSRTFSGMLGGAYVDITSRLTLGGLSSLAKEDVSAYYPSEEELERMGILGDLYRVVRAAYLYEEGKKAEAYGLLKDRASFYIKALSVDERANIPRFLTWGTFKGKDGNAAFFIATAGGVFMFLGNVADLPGVGVRMDNARNAMAMVVKYIDRHAYPYAWETAMLVASRIGAPIYDYAASLLLKGEEGSIVAAKSIANLSSYAGAVASGTLVDLINRMPSSTPVEAMNWLGIALGYAIYNDALTRAGMIQPTRYGTWYPARVSMKELHPLYKTTLQELLNAGAYEGVINVVSFLLRVEGPTTSFPIEDYFERAVQGLGQGRMLDAMSVRNLAYSAVFLGRQDVAKASIESLIRAGEWSVTSALLTDLMTLFGSRVIINNQEMYRLATSVPELGELLNYLQQIAEDPTVPSHVRGTILNFIQLIRTGSVIVQRPPEGMSA